MDDLKRIKKQFEDILEKEFSAKAGMILIFTVPPEYKTAQFLTNLKIADAIDVLQVNLKNLQKDYN